MKLKKSICLAALAVGAALALSACSEDAPLAINEKNFPDAEVRDYVSQNYDSDGNGWLTANEIAAMRAAEGYSGSAEDLPGMSELAEMLYEKQHPSVAINAANFPDEAFRNYVSQYCDTDGNGKLSQSEIAAVTYIGCGSQGITSMQGLEYFTALTFLDCRSNNLGNLDVSNNKALEHLECSYCSLTSLDVSQNTALEYLACTRNALTSLDVTHNTKLKELYCSENDLGSLDVSKNTELVQLSCSYTKLSSLDVSKNTKLQRLGCYGNSIKELDLSHNSVILINMVYYDKGVKVTQPVRNYGN